ncbi:uncharacterized protein LOC110989747 [Acanthaster planci]|uniref:Uncharacterized protein LOC110989747 n=1 Tax=Acanthaster planci TaxID=133434 RepID=A0A8B8A2D9_ACAPL|nr:uncharacterized protein LOC110989747 [Acanthaster planci]
MDCPTFQDSSPTDRFKIVKEHHLCFPCLIQGHKGEECEFKKKCGKNGCLRMHHTLIHFDPPSSSAVSTLDKDGIPPVLRVIFRAENAGPIDLIHGVQYSHHHAEEEVQGLQFEPVGKKTPLGWFVIDPDNTKSSTSRVSVSTIIKECLDFNRLYDLETLGVRALNCSCPVNGMSKDDRTPMEMFANSCHKEGDRYMIGLPWKKDPSLLPNNRPLTEKRLASLERSLSKNPDKASMYDKAVGEYVDKGWAVQVSDKAAEGPVNYLPHHGIYQPEKISTR